MKRNRAVTALFNRSICRRMSTATFDHQALSNSYPPRAATTPPVRITVGKNLGLHVSWFVYRGAGKVAFDPPQVKVWEDTRAGANSPWAPIWIADPMPADGRSTATVTFDRPGTYVLRCRADDGALVSDQEITIVVTP